MDKFKGGKNFEVTERLQLVFPIVNRVVLFDYLDQQI